MEVPTEYLQSVIRRVTRVVAVFQFHRQLTWPSCCMWDRRPFITQFPRRNLCKVVCTWGKNIPNSSPMLTCSSFGTARLLAYNYGAFAAGNSRHFSLQSNWSTRCDIKHEDRLYRCVSGGRVKKSPVCYNAPVLRKAVLFPLMGIAIGMEIIYFHSVYK